jgi:drug/metabolite transporter (DMT)-like permease
MNRLQKKACLNLIAIATGFALGAIVAAVLLTVKVRMPLNLNTAHICGLVLAYLCGIAVASQILFRRKADKVDFDERDDVIRKRASLTAFTVFYLSFGSAVLLPFFILGPKGSVSVQAGPIIFVGGLIVVIVVFSVAILVQYGWTAKGEES